MADILHLSHLKKLKRLSLPGNKSHSRKALIDAFTENNVPIEILNLNGINPDYLEILPKLELTTLSQFLKIW